MTADGIVHTYQSYDGDHVNHIAARFELKVLPFFSRNLIFDGDGGKEE